MARLPHDRLDGRASLGSGDNVCVDFFASQLALVLKPLGSGE
jgi:hypothetical protein